MKSLKILAVGNSFSICAGHVMPYAVLFAGQAVKFTSAYIGGCSLEMHCANLEKSDADPDFRPYKDTIWYTANGSVICDELGNASLTQMLKDDVYDIVTIQQASHLSWQKESYQPYAEQLIARIRRDQPQAEIMIQQTWAYRSQDARLNDGGEWGITQQEMYEKLDAAYRKLAQDYGFRRIPTGTAVQIAREKYPVKYRRITAEELKNYSPPDLPPQYGDPVGKMWWYKEAGGAMKIGEDNIHLNSYGEYLQGYVWFGALFGIDPRTAGAVYESPDISSEDGKFLRECAYGALKAEGYEF